MNREKEQLQAIIDVLPEKAVTELLYHAEFTKGRYDFIKGFTDKGVIATDYDGAYLRKQWEEAFANTISKSRKYDEIYFD
ncbi:hypothetical protein ACSVDA_19505 [Cytobacillus sp. Hm23]